VNKAYREDRPELLEFVKKYGIFLLIFSYVMGSITGPGIWYSTTVGSPKGISAHYIGENEQEDSIFFDEFQQFRPVFAIRLVHQIGEEDRHTDRGMGKEHVDRRDERDPIAGSHGWIVPGGIEADQFHDNDSLLPALKE
jgi:hypothetical protein